MTDPHDPLDEVGEPTDDDLAAIEDENLDLSNLDHYDDEDAEYNPYQQ